MKEYKVTEILSEPRRMTLRMDHMFINYWSVVVVLEGYGKKHESAVTYESFEEAQKLKIGDVFLR